MRIEPEIERARRVVRSREAQGHSDERALAEEYLRGLLFGQACFSDAVNPPCPHVRHSAEGLDGFGHTIWRCQDCGEVTNV